MNDNIEAQILDATPDGLIAVDRAGMIVFANRRAETLFGYQTGTLRGQNLDGLVPEYVQRRHRAYRESYQQYPRLRPMGAGLDLRGRRRDGSEFAVEISLAPILEEDVVVAAIRELGQQSARARGADTKASRRTMLYVLIAMGFANVATLMVTLFK